MHGAIKTQGKGFWHHSKSFVLADIPDQTNTCFKISILAKAGEGAFARIETNTYRMQ